MNEETIEKIISKHKLYMSMDSYEYEAITKVDLYKLIEEIERLNNIIKEVREYTNKMMTLAERKGKNGEENGALYVAVADILEILDKTN